MKDKWMIKEELIEWPDTGSPTPKRCCPSVYAREIALIDPLGKVRARRCVHQKTPLEAFLLLKGNRCYGWKEILNIVRVAPVPSHVQHHLTTYGLLLYEANEFDLTTFMEPAQWRLCDRFSRNQTNNINGHTTSSLTEYVYNINDDNKEHLLEWRVYLMTAPAFFREIAAYSELVLDKQIYRRHVLLYYRTASQTDREQFQPPREYRVLSDSLESTLFTANYKLPGIVK